MKLRKILAIVMAACISATALAGCAGAPATSSGAASTAESSTAASTAESSTAESGAPSVGDTSAYPGTPDANMITLNLTAEPTKLNTLLSTYSYEFVVIKNLYENLVMLDKDDKVIPGVAESWTISDDQLTYTFKLREGMKWTNGEPVTAKDFVFAWSQLIDPKVASNYAYFGYGLFKNAKKYYDGECKIEDVGFKAKSDYELEVVLENPTPYALFMFSFGSLAPVNEKFYNEVGADMYNTDPQYFCTNGAFMVESWTHDSDLVLKKNPDYYRAADVSLEKIKYLMIKDTNAALNSFKAGELDVHTLTGDQITQMTNENYPMIDYVDGSEFHVLLNNEDKYMSNVNLRRAINLAYDREAYVKAIRKDKSTYAAGFTTGVKGASGSQFRDDVIAKYGELYPKNAQPEEAKKYLETALKELNCKIEDLSKNISMNTADDDVSAAQAAFFQEQLRTNLGIEIQIKPMTVKAQSAERDSGNFVMDFTGWGPDYDDPMTFLDMWVTDGGNNSVKFSNARYDELIALAAKETDVNKRQEYFLECEKIIADEVPISPTMWRIRTYIVSDKIADGYWRTTFSDQNFAYATLK